MLGRIGQYQILGELAQGGMGTVYRAHDSQLGRDVALKLLRTDKPMDARGLERFRREVLTLAQFQHPSVVRVHTAGTHGGLPYFVQDLVEGQSLDRRLKDSGPLLPAEAASAAQKLAAALHAAHEAGILHRDVKPANVIMTSLGEPILIDFGVAKNAALELSKTGLTKTGQGLGSPGYWSPEQACGELDQIGPRSDVYSLGATLYALLVGRAPFEGEGIAGNLMLTINEQPRPPSELQSDVPADLEAICLKCLEKEPECRYATACDLEQDLQRFLRGETPLARSGSKPHSRAHARKLRLVVAALTIPGLLAGTLLALPPPVEIRSPTAGASVPGDQPLTVEILAGGLLPVRGVEINDTPATENDDGVYTVHLRGLAEGEHELRAIARGSYAPPRSPPPSGWTRPRPC